MSDINWDDAPEGATHYDAREGVYPWVMADDNGKKYWYFNRWVKYANDIGVNDSISSKPVTSPIYTQEMADNGELPSVGMECFFHHSNWQPLDFEKGYLLASTNEYIIYKLNSNACEQSCRRKLMSFSPLTPPIELIDGEFYCFDYSNKSYRGIYSKKEDRFIFADGHVMASYCKNIKLLEVK